MFPVVALAVSTFLEGFVWTWMAVLGVALVLAGNLLVLSRAPAPVTAPGKPAYGDNAV
jgi:drug/metabolite transporter (DMT)-like permease